MTERLHPDEHNAVESRAQTEHKLEIMRRYYPSFANIIAQSKSRQIDNRQIWLVDLFAGAGLHRSADHPDGRVFGTALQACAAARDVQARFPNTTVHVRLVDLETRYCDRLRERTAAFREKGVDVTVYEQDYARAIEPILAEIQATAPSLSLWLVDPHGPSILSFKSLLPLVTAPRVEVIINLDVTGIERMRGFVLSKRVLADSRFSDAVGKQRAKLNELYRGRIWEDPGKHIHVKPGMKLDGKLAAAYASTFRRFRFAEPYALRSSDSQFRYLIHLTQSPAGYAAFQKAYKASWNIGTTKGRALTDTDCARIANGLLKSYAGMNTTLEEIYADTAVDLDRGQLGRVLRYASNNCYGSYDGVTMSWATERVDQFTLPSERVADDLRLF